ncbi:MAG: recombinase family protein, partial [Lactococcus cremoris]
MEINKLKAALYVRVSTTEQANEGYSISAQTEKLTNYAKAKDYQIVKTYTDPGISGAKLDRPALQNMITDIEKGMIDIVLVYKLDRLSRSQKNTL